MPSLPESEIYLLVRTYFDDEPGWEALRAIVEEGSPDGFFANPEYVDDRHFDGFSVQALEVVHPHRANGWDVMYVADERAIKEAVHPLLVVRVGSSEDLPFRCRADKLDEVDANLSLANLDWDDFREAVDESGVYGGVAVATGPRPDVPTDPAVAAYRSASDEQITISVPYDLGFEIFEDLRETSFGVTGPGYKDVIAISKEIIRQTEAVTREDVEDDYVVTLSAAQWAFIGERAKKMRSIYSQFDDERDRGVIGGRIVDLIAASTR